MWYKVRRYVTTFQEVVVNADSIEELKQKAENDEVGNWVDSWLDSGDEDAEPYPTGEMIIFEPSCEEEDVAKKLEEINDEDEFQKIYDKNDIYWSLYTERSSDTDGGKWSD